MYSGERVRLRCAPRRGRREQAGRVEGPSLERRQRRPAARACRRTPRRRPRTRPSRRRLRRPACALRRRGRRTCPATTAIEPLDAGVCSALRPRPASTTLEVARERRAPGRPTAAARPRRAAAAERSRRRRDASSAAGCESIQLSDDVDRGSGVDAIGVANRRSVEPGEHEARTPPAVAVQLDDHDLAVARTPDGRRVRERLRAALVEDDLRVRVQMNRRLDRRATPSCASSAASPNEIAPRCRCPAARGTSRSAVPAPVSSRWS